MTAPRLLLVDDDPATCFAIADYLSHHAIEVTVAGHCAGALELVRGSTFDLAVIDHNLPDGNSQTLLHALRGECPDLAVVILTGVSDLDLAVRSLQEGADHFLTKPIDLATMLVILQRTLSSRRNARLAASRALRPTASSPFASGGEATRALARTAERVAASTSPILILGETGAGKGVLARWIHHASARGAEPWVELNCAGLSRELVESELFGHERGSFTGAATAKPGLLEVANRGTIFLDEVAELDLVVQAKLLKVLEEQRFRRIGSVHDVSVSVRLIAATSAPVRAMVEDGRFRKDLYFRLATVILTVPPLRERRDEIAALARAILAQLSPVHGRQVLAPDAIAALEAYPWAGNVRELRNVLERAALFTDGTIIDGKTIEQHLHVDGAAALHAEPAARKLTLAEVEREHIAAVLGACRGQVDEAAQWLGVPRSTLYEKIRRLKLTPGD
jgi:DNA-binding NtrC family response regulator